MKRFLLCFVALVFMAPMAAARAQLAEPTPTPDPQTYNDPAMSFTAPVGAVLVSRQTIGLAALNNDLQTVAIWLLHPGQDDMRTISISMEAYEGAPDQWEGQFESQTHGEQEGVLIRNKTAMSLLNGMPAYYVEVASGSGFGAQKEYAIVWADGQRGVVLSVTGRLGYGSQQEALNLLKQVTAVRYPSEQP